MTSRRQVAPIRFGLGLRLGETPPEDPSAWLAAQLSAPAGAPAGASSEEAIRVRAAAIAERRARDATQTPGERMEGEARSALVALNRAEARDWAQHRLLSPAPFRERLVDFWANHFTVSRRAGVVGALCGPLEREAIRPHLTGRFADMLVAVTSHPAMLVYLDNNTSIGPNSRVGQRIGRGLNENLAREVLELHTLSPAGGYSQGDVQELAKILTGWSVSLAREPFGFAWRPNAHEPGPKNLLGRRFPEGEGSQEAALRFLGTRPATYRHIAAKLARHFISDDPPPEAVRRLAEALQRTEGDLGAAYAVLIELPEAWEPPLGKFRMPKDHVLAAARAVGFEGADPVLAGMAGLGQPLWTAPQPNGWPDVAESWAAPEALMRRVDWSYTFAARAGGVDLPAVAETALGPLLRAETVAAMRGAGSVRDALTLLFGSPEFMRR